MIGSTCPELRASVQQEDWGHKNGEINIGYPTDKKLVCVNIMDSASQDSSPLEFPLCLSFAVLRYPGDHAHGAQPNGPFRVGDYMRGQVDEIRRPGIEA